MMAAEAAPEFLQMPMAAPSPPRLADPKVETLKSMFPDIDADVLEAMLQFQNGDVEATASTILETATSQTDLDEEFARKLQAEDDEQVARTVHKELQAELERARQNEPAVRAAAAVEKAATSAKNLLQRAVRPLSARGRASSTHATRLLDSPASEPAFDFSPLQLGAYQPNYQPSEPAAPYHQNYSYEPSATAAAAPPGGPPAVGGEAQQPPSERYSARLDRARSANLLSQRAPSSGRIAVPSPLHGNTILAPLAAPTPPPPAPPPARPHVPEGDLI